MKINKQILDDLSRQAVQSPRLRMNLDLRTSPSDNSQRMLNALEPGTQIPVHRHTKSTEVLVMLRGRIRQNYYDDNGNVTDSFIVEAGSDICALSVPVGQWHNTEALESGTVFFECKDGAYEPLGPEDVMQICR